MLEYPPEQLWPLYEKLPKDLQEAIFSEKTADLIYDICTRNGLEKEMSEIAKLTGYVLLGLLPPDEFEKTLKEELKLNNDLNKKVVLEITRFIFFPVKESLEALYKIEIAKPTKPLSTTTLDPAEKKLKKDIYREEID